MLSVAERISFIDNTLNRQQIEEQVNKIPSIAKLPDASKKDIVDSILAKDSQREIEDLVKHHIKINSKANKKIRFKSHRYKQGS